MRAITIILSILLFLQPAYGLAPRIGAVRLGPFQVSLKQFDIKELTRDDQGSQLILIQKETGDEWAFNFDERIYFPNSITDPIINLPRPTRIGFDLFSMPEAENWPPDVQDLRPKEERISWVDFEGKAEFFSAYEWKVKIWKAQALERKRNNLINGHYEPGNSQLYESFVGERGYFQIKMNGVPFFEGDSIWGLPVKRRINGEELLFIYRRYPGPVDWESHPPKIPDQIAIVHNGDLVIHNVTQFENIDNRIRFLKGKLTEKDKLPASQLRSYRRQFNRLRQFNRDLFFRKVQDLIALKKELLQKLSSFPEDYKWSTRVRDPNEPKDERDLKNIIYRIHRLQRSLAYSSADRIQNAILQLETDLIRVQLYPHNSLVVRNEYGDEIGYTIMGNQESVYPPVLVFSGWKGVLADPFFKQIKETSEGKKLLSLFRFIVVTLPTYPHHSEEETNQLFSNRNGKEINYFMRAAKAIEPILEAEGNDSAFVLGSRLGAFVAGEAAKLFWTNIKGKEPKIKLEGMILFDPALYNPAHGVQLEITDFFPFLNKRLLVPIKSIINGVLNYNLLYLGWRKLKANSRGVKHIAELIYKRLKGVLNGNEDVLTRQEIEARLDAYFSLLSQTQFQIHERISALKLGPTLFLVRNSNAEGRALKRALQNNGSSRAKVLSYYSYEKYGPMNMEILFNSLMKIVEENFLARKPMVFQNLTPLEKAL